MNAIMNKNCTDLAGCSIYVALFPCNECAKLIIQAGIKEVIFYSDKHSHKPETIASKRMMDMAKVRYRYGSFDFYFLFFPVFCSVLFILRVILISNK